MSKSRTERFSATIEHYHQYRPSYPHELLETIFTECSLGPESIVADIGSGTGIFTMLLLEKGLTCYGVEPNTDMRNKAEIELASFDNFHSITGRADQTNLADNSVDGIICAQAFHWFNEPGTRVEFKRILKQNAKVALVWNLRNNTTPLMQAYENLLRKFGTDYTAVAAENIKDEDIASFFENHNFKKLNIDNHQSFDWDGFRGRLLSTSYTPKPGESGYEAMLKEAENIYAEHQKDGKVTFDYDCLAFIGNFE